MSLLQVLKAIKNKAHYYCEREKIKDRATIEKMTSNRFIFKHFKKRHNGCFFLHLAIAQNK